MSQPTMRLFCLFAAALLTTGATSAQEADLISDLGLRESDVPSRDLPGWKPPQKIVVYAFEPGRAESLSEVVPGVELIAAPDRQAILSSIADADVFIGFCMPEAIDAGGQLRWVQSMSAGVERCVSNPSMIERQILLTNAQRLYGPAMAEHTIAMMMALNRGLDVYIGNQQDGRWAARNLENAYWELDGRTMLVVGLGGIGTEVARLADALGMRVIATRNSSRNGPEFVEQVGLANELPEMIAQADVVVNVTPLTPETIGMFDAELFALMKPGAYFINIGRGRSVVTDDLVAALEEGVIAGAALDVTDPEPLPADHPLWQVPRVIITPHMSATSDLSGERRWQLVRENLRRYAAGEPMLSVVDLERQY